MRRKADVGLAERPLSIRELEVLAESLDGYQQAQRYAGAIAPAGEGRRDRFDRARVATKLLARVEVDQGRLRG